MNGPRPLPVTPAAPAPADESAFVRLWLGFCTARVAVGAALLALLVGVRLLGTPPGVSGWVLAMCATYLAAALAVRLLLQPARPGAPFDPQWVSSIGVDLLVFAALVFLQAGGIWFAPLLAIPVLMAAVLGSTLLALGTAAAVALLLLADAWVLVLQGAGEPTQRFLQAGLTGTGYFVLALLAHQLALRLAREEEAARASRQAALVQGEVSRLVIESMAEGVLVVDGGGQVLALNPVARELLGLAPSVPAAVQLDQRPGWAPLADIARRAYATGETLLQDLALQQDGGAPPRRMLARSRLARSPDLAGQGLCVLFLQDLREMEARLRTEKLAAMGRMSTAVAHEIRNPLAAISQANELLQEELTDPVQRQLGTLVRQNVLRLTQTVEEILDLARVEHRGPDGGSVLALDATAFAHCHDWIAQHRAGTQVALLAQAPGVQVRFDADHLRRVLVNLLDNARRYASSADGAIQVASAIEDEAIALLTVWSDGAPLEESVEQHLFEPFFSSESRSSGLGLYICRELCERHGASIGYRRGPAPGGGRRDGNAFFVALRTARAAVPGAFATIAP